MKTLKNVLVVLLLSVSMTVVANNGSTKGGEKSSTVSQVISTLLKNPYFKVEETLKAKVSFMINSKNEIVVLSVDSQDEKLDAYIKRRLNYSKFEDSGLKKNVAYVLPVRIIKA
ncbi:hypothetical protein [Aurantibacter sp.]|uniref:hypothetical protein n=1 Tax=Aurantibacter sp. TaxID=2807103 RepID=UPI0035C7D283